MIAFNCACGEPLAAAPEHAGLQVQCPKCDARLTIPAAESEFDYADDPTPPPPKNKAKLVDEEERKPKRRRKQRNSRDDDEPEHVRRLMDRANAELDEDEARRAREGGGIHFTPGLIGGALAFVVGSLLVVLFICLPVPFKFCIICFCGAIAVGGLVRCVLSFLGQGVD